ncbi:hypothetical protein F4808DRAFT_192089 [Astrocystis sublimbata]|nr:hypothetical protein F4808DRAFT_192089 [Astrocystis sublimbata]
MDIIGAAASVGQLLAQAIGLWQQFESARDIVKTAPQVLANTSANLANLSDIVLEIRHKPELCTPEIHAQINIIGTIATEICQRLEVMARIQSRSILRQRLRAFSRGPRDEAKLADVLRQLEAAKVELVIRMHLAHVSITGKLADDIGRLVQDPGIANQSRLTKGSDGHCLLIQDNETEEDGSQVNSIMGLEASPKPTTAKITGNVARGGQTNFIGGKDVLKFLNQLHD